MCARQDYQIEVKFSVAPPSGCKTMRLNNCSGLISETNLQVINFDFLSRLMFRIIVEINYLFNHVRSSAGTTIS